MAKIAILGYGTVGSGVAEVLDTNADVIAKKAGEKIETAKILDIREFPGDPRESLIVHDFDEIVSDPEIEAVAEVMGGLHPAYEFTKAALTAGKSVCTSNKALVAEFGPELSKIAKEHGVSYLYEASCGGGIPIIRPLRNALTSDRILAIGGIFNGTTNFILTKMEAEGGEYADVLHLAQELGYAERDPSADVDGWDTVRKLAILGSIAYDGNLSYKDIPTEGISRITQTDIRYARAFGRRIKLLAVSEESEEGVRAVVCPVMIAPESPLYAISDVFNAVLVTGNMLGDVMFYGQGAGKEPTGSAVVSDIVELVKKKGKCDDASPADRAISVLPAEDMTWRYFVRLSLTPEHAAAAVDILGVAKGDMRIDVASGEGGVMTRPMTEKEFREVIAKVPACMSYIRAAV